MKKLLAMILCVVMVLSLAPAAFAAYDTTDQRVWKGASQSKDVIDALSKNIENMYASIAVDNAVISSIKSVDSMVGDMIDKMLEGYTPSGFGTGLNPESLKDAIKAGMRSSIGGTITDYVSKHTHQYIDFDSHGNPVFNPIKYAGVFSSAASEALASEKAVNAIQAFMVYMLQRSTYESVAQQAGLLKADMPTWWGAYGFDDASKASVAGWSVPGAAINNAYNLDGVLHHVNDTYDEFLSRLGQLGVDLNNDGILSIGFDGWVVDVDGNIRAADAKETENVNTPLVKKLFADIDGDGTITADEWTALVYESATGTYYAVADSDGDGKLEYYRDDGTQTDLTGAVVPNVYGLTDPTNGNASPYFFWTGTDDQTAGVPGESAAEVVINGVLQAAGITSADGGMDLIE